MKNFVRIAFVFAFAVSAFSAVGTAQTLIDDLELGGIEVLDQQEDAHSIRTSSASKSLTCSGDAASGVS
jgi:hypothetical protein